MRFRHLPLALGAALGLLVRAPAAAQAPATPTRLTVEPHVTLAVPSGAVAERWGVGAGLGVLASLHLHPRFALYAGYSGTRFDLDVTDDTHALDRGLAAGVALTVPELGGGAMVPWVRAGVLAHRLSVVRRGDAGEESGPADGGAGLEAGAGISTRRGSRIRPTLGLEYRGYRARVLGAERETVSYVALRGGVAFAF